MAPSGPLPVTLLSGFLGAGKTTLLQHILTSNHGLRIAVVVNDIGAVNVDASIIKNHRVTKTEEKVVAMQNGCICCTLRGDLLEELVKLSKLREFDYVVIESSGVSEPEQVAETFDDRLAEQITVQSLQGDVEASIVKAMEEIRLAGGVGKFAKLDTTVTVIDSFTMLNDFDTQDLLSSRRHDVTPEDDRTVSDLMADQIEFANVIILNKLDMIDNDKKIKLVHIVKSLNPDAKIIETKRGKVDPSEIVNTQLFDIEKAKAGYGWLKDIHEMTIRQVDGRSIVAPQPETEEYDIRNFIYQRTRPFHPRRLEELIYDKFILMLDDDGDDDEDEESEEESHKDDGDVVMDNDPGYSDFNQENELKSTGCPSKHGSPCQDNSTVCKPSHEADEDSDTVSKSKSVAANRQDVAVGSRADEPDCSDIGMSSVEDTDESADMQSTPQTIPEDQDEENDLCAPDNEVILANKRSHPVFSGLYRSKGNFWLATRPSQRGSWSQAGAMLTLAGDEPFLCNLEPEDYLTGDERFDQMLNHSIEKGGEWGDRDTELVFIGYKLERQQLSSLLDECLLNDEEWELWQTIMRNKDISMEDKIKELESNFEDLFPKWYGEDDHDHDHEHGNEPSHNMKPSIRNFSDHKHEIPEVD